MLRIGYRPTVGPQLNVGADTAHVRIVFRGDAVVLSTINVRDKETCRVGADTGLIVARVWAEARKAVLSSQLSADGAPLVADWIVYDRMLDSSGRIVRSQRVRSATNPTTHAFHSLPADRLADTGYVISDDSGTTYYAPDADVLLSDSFASTHCFHLEAAAGDDHLIGVAFAPARSHRDARDIEGVLWLDRQTAELETLEFDYTNLPDVVRPAHPGGRVEFLRLSDGNWLVNRWSVRMPDFAFVTGGGSNALEHREHNPRIDRHFEFEERLRMHAANAAFTKEEIDKRGPVDVWQTLTNVPGVLVVDSGMVTAESTRGKKVTPDLQLVPCYFMILVDGLEMKPTRPSDAAYDLRLLPKPNEVHGMEVFDGPAIIPVQYSGAGDNKWCGMIMIWTR